MNSYIKIFIPTFFLLYLHNIPQCQIDISTETTTSTNKVNSKQLSILKEAENLYNLSIESYEKGKIKKSRKLYNKSMKKLFSIIKEPEINYNLKSEFSSIFNNLYSFYSPEPYTIDEEKPEDNFEIDVSSINQEISKNKYTIPMDRDQLLVLRYLKLYTIGMHRNIIERAFERSGKYRNMILKILAEYNLPEELVYLPVVESLYKIDAYSKAGAAGLWQLMPGTARGLGLKVNYWVDERRDPEKSTHAAAKYLKYLYTLFDDWYLALASYNRGEHGISRDLKFAKAADFSQLGTRDAIPEETEHFVPKFIAVTLIGDNLSEYGFSPVFEDPLEYDEVIVNQPIDLEVIAKCAGTTVSKIRELNPSIIVWCTPKNYSDFKLRLPKGTKEKYLEEIVKVKDLNPSRGVIRYKVKAGDNLSKIAEKYCTTVNDIKELNKIRNPDRLSIGTTLIIRPGKRYYLKKGE